MNQKFNTKQHNKTRNFVVEKALHEVGIGICQLDQTNQQVYWKKNTL